MLNVADDTGLCPFTSAARHWPVLVAELADHLADLLQAGRATTAGATFLLDISSGLLPDAASGPPPQPLLQLARWLADNGVQLRATVPLQAIPLHCAQLLPQTPQTLRRRKA